MDLNLVREQLTAGYMGNPQMAMMANQALDRIQEGIGVLASMGHRFQLEPEAPPKIQAQASRGRS